jgi:hypothetical protein
MTKNFQKSSPSREFVWRERFLKVFSHEFADFEIDYKINEWLIKSENLDLRSFFKEILRKNIKSTYLNESKSPIFQNSSELGRF